MNKAFFSLLAVILLILVIGGGYYSYLAGWVSADRPIANPAAVSSDPARSGLASRIPALADKSDQPGAVAGGTSTSYDSLRESMRRDGESLKVETRPDGMELLDLGGRFNHVSAAVRTPSGEMKIQCFSVYSALDGAIIRGTRDHPAKSDSHDAVKQ